MISVTVSSIPRCIPPPSNLSEVNSNISHIPAPVSYTHLDVYKRQVVGSNGVIIAPVKWYQGVRALCDKYDILMVADAVMAG